MASVLAPTVVATTAIARRPSPKRWRVRGLNNQPIDGKMGWLAMMRAAMKRARAGRAMARVTRMAGNEESNGDGDEGGG